MKINVNCYFFSMAREEETLALEGGAIYFETSTHTYCNLQMG